MWISCWLDVFVRLHRHPTWSNGMCVGRSDAHCMPTYYSYCTTPLYPVLDCTYDMYLWGKMGRGATHNVRMCVVDTIQRRQHSLVACGNTNNLYRPRRKIFRHVLSVVRTYDTVRLALFAAVVQNPNILRTVLFVMGSHPYEYVFGRNFLFYRMVNWFLVLIHFRFLNHVKFFGTMVDSYQWTYSGTSCWDHTERQPGMKTSTNKISTARFFCCFFVLFFFSSSFRLGVMNKNADNGNKSQDFVTWHQKQQRQERQLALLSSPVWSTNLEWAFDNKYSAVPVHTSTSTSIHIVVDSSRRRVHIYWVCFLFFFLYLYFFFLYYPSYFYYYFGKVYCIFTLPKFS